MLAGLEPAAQDPDLPLGLDPRYRDVDDGEDAADNLRKEPEASYKRAMDRTKTRDMVRKAYSGRRFGKRPGRRVTSYGGLCPKGLGPS
jgi:hypothetical protein